MKDVKRMMKLTNLKSEGLDEKEQKVVTGGHYCGCYYSNCNGSSDGANDSANAALGPYTMSFLPIGQAEWNYA